MGLQTISEWSESVNISRQAGAKAIARCGIPVRKGLVDGEEATRLYRDLTRPRMNARRDVPRPATQAWAAAVPAVELEQLVRRANDLGLVAAAALDRGHFKVIEPDLRAAMAAVPLSARERVEWPRRVWDAITGAVGEQLERRDEPLSEEEAAEMGEFWGAVAAGEIRSCVT
jgi:hypothetical protein